MTDTAPLTTEELRSRVAAMSPADREALLRETLADVEAVVPIDTATRAALLGTPGPPPPPVAAAPPASAIKSTRAHGRNIIERTTTPVDDDSSVALNVDGELYPCLVDAPADMLTEALDAHASGNGVVIIRAMRDLLSMAMVPEAWDRYQLRLRGMARRAGEPEEVAPSLPAIGLLEMAQDGAKLLEVYTGRPTGPLPSSGDSGSATSTPSTPGA